MTHDTIVALAVLGAVGQVFAAMLIPICMYPLSLTTLFAAVHRDCRFTPLVR
jgi:hypothetical protein